MALNRDVIQFLNTLLYLNFLWTKLVRYISLLVPTIEELIFFLIYSYIDWHLTFTYFIINFFFVYFAVDYVRGESPHVLETGSYTQTANPPRIALSPDAEVLAVSVDSSIEFYDTYTGKLYDTVENVYLGKYIYYSL